MDCTNSCGLFMRQRSAQSAAIFAIIHDWRIIQGQLKEGIAVDETDIRKNEAGIKVFGELHRLKKPKLNSSDPYHKTWHGGVSLADMANCPASAGNGERVCPLR